MTQKKKSSLQIPRGLYYGLIAVFTLALLVSLVLLARYFVDSWRTNQEYDALASIRDQHLATATTSDPTTTTGEGLPSTSVDPSQGTSASQPVDPTVAGGILPEYQAIYEMNSELVGWIQIPDTQIDYPVMQSSLDNRDFYLNHKFDKSWGDRGAIYAREQCDINKPSDNITLYGHHMRDGSMFAGLDKFKRKDFWETHQTFTFDTLYERHTYQIFAVFKTSASVGSGFRYHQMVDAADQAAFDEFITTIKSLAFYDTGITPQYGDKLLCLSTCEYSQPNGRFVVVAMRIS